MTTKYRYDEWAFNLQRRSISVLEGVIHGLRNMNLKQFLDHASKMENLPTQLFKQPNCGVKTCNEILCFLSEQGVRVSGERVNDVVYQKKQENIIDVKKAKEQSERAGIKAIRFAIAFLNSQGYSVTKK